MKKYRIIALTILIIAACVAFSASAFAVNKAKTEKGIEIIKLLNGDTAQYERYEQTSDEGIRANNKFVYKGEMYEYLLDPDDLFVSSIRLVESSDFTKATMNDASEISFDDVRNNAQALFRLLYKAYELRDIVEVVHQSENGQYIVEICEYDEFWQTGNKALLTYSCSGILLDVAAIKANLDKRNALLSKSIRMVDLISAEKVARQELSNKFGLSPLELKQEGSPVSITSNDVFCIRSAYEVDGEGASSQKYIVDVNAVTCEIFRIYEN